MNRSWSGPLVAGLIAMGVAAILFFNIQPGREPSAKPVVSVATQGDLAVGANLPERPIGDPVVENHVRVAAVWLAGVAMEGMDATSGVIHLEADVKATEGNPNGFAKDEFVPYLKVSYTLADARSGALIDQGSMAPMVASDGLHYGASVAMPKAGDYKLVYHVEPPSAGGLGRHVGAGGVAPWWKPFDASFDWAVEPSPTTALAKGR